MSVRSVKQYGRIQLKTLVLTTVAPEGNFRPAIKNRYSVIAAGIRTQLMDAARVTALYLYDGTTPRRLTPDLSIDDNYNVQYDLSNVFSPLIIDNVNYIRVGSSISGTDQDATAWLYVLEWLEGPA